MKTVILQSDILWADPAGNIRKADDAISSVPGADLYILPEMFSTGFCTSPEGIAETDGFSLDWMKRKSAQCGAAIAGSVAGLADGKYYTLFYFVKPDGEVVSYDKKHLFTYGKEHEAFTAGDSRVIVEYLGVRILLEICYDLRFPVWSRNCGDYDMIIYVASWPASRISAWNSLLVARAIENQCYVVGVNRVGDDPSNSYSGGSKIVDPYGNVIACCPDGAESHSVADIDMEMLEAFRRKFPVLNDADRII